MRGEGTRLVKRGMATSNAKVAAAIAGSAIDAEPRACHMAEIRSKKVSGARVSVRARTSLTWSVAITAAIPR